MRPCDTIAKRPLTSTRLMSLYYTKARLSHTTLSTGMFYQVWPIAGDATSSVNRV